jgi:hypothetical protein
MVKPTVVETHRVSPYNPAALLKRIDATLAAVASERVDFDSALTHEATVYSADPTGGQPSQY